MHEGLASDTANGATKPVTTGRAHSASHRVAAPAVQLREGDRTMGFGRWSDGTRRRPLRLARPPAARQHEQQRHQRDLRGAGQIGQRSARSHRCWTVKVETPEICTAPKSVEALDQRQRDAGRQRRPRQGSATAQKAPAEVRPSVRATSSSAD